jgi:hypothetical protein
MSVSLDIAQHLLALSDLCNSLLMKQETTNDSYNVHASVAVNHAFKHFGTFEYFFDFHNVIKQDDLNGECEEALHHSRSCFLIHVIMSHMVESNSVNIWSSSRISDFNLSVCLLSLSDLFLVLFRAIKIAET